MSRLCMKRVLQPHFMHRSSFFLQHPHLPLMTSKYKNLPGIGGWQALDGSQALVLYDDERLRTVLKWLPTAYSGQILVFTCHEREMRVLKEEGAAVHEVRL